MLRPRIIPCLLVQDGGLVKTVKFADAKYVGDPINAVKIFNEKQADELIVLDIDATVKANEPNYKQISHLSAECRMPLCYGGGVKTAKQAKKIVSLGVEKVAVSSALVERPALAKEMADEVGSQSVVAVLDVKSSFLGRSLEVWTHNGKRNSKRKFIDLATELVQLGVGEIVLNSIDLDGTMKGYDRNAAKELRQHVDVPITILGGAGSLEHMESVVADCGVMGLAAGSLFVFKGAYRAVLINYPSELQKEKIFKSAISKI